METIVIRETKHNKYVFDPSDRMYKMYKDGFLSEMWTEGEWFENQRTFYSDLMSQREGLQKLQRELSLRSNELDKRRTELDRREETINNMVKVLAYKAGE